MVYSDVGRQDKRPWGRQPVGDRNPAALSQSPLDEHLQIFDLARIKPNSVPVAFVDLDGAIARVSTSLHPGAANGA
jgi:hypothetical protein